MASAMAAASRRASRILGTTTATGLARAQQFYTPAGVVLSRGLHTSNTPLQATHPTSADIQGAAAGGVGTHTPAIIERLAGKIREIAPEQTETYRAYSKGKELYQECARQAAYMGPGQKIEMSDRAKFWYIGMCARHPSTLLEIDRAYGIGGVNLGTLAKCVVQIASALTLSIHGLKSLCFTCGPCLSASVPTQTRRNMMSGSKTLLTTSSMMQKRR